ncbi:MAG: hypothetical protein HUJ93_04400 [Bacteroidales bacterium]|nr:hypothetical protein [Bacteroidales bacterium]
MKKIFPAILICMAMTACGQSVSKIEEVASNYLTSFFAMDYDAACTLCSEEVAAAIRFATSAVEIPSEELRTKIEKASQSTTFEIISSEIVSGKGETPRAKVCYNITTPTSEKAIPKEMTLEKRESGWIITGLI